MADLTDLDSVAGDDLSLPQLQGILSQIDLDITNLVRDGKLSATRYGTGGAAGLQMDRAANLRVLLEARSHFQRLVQSYPACEVSIATE